MKLSDIDIIGSLAAQRTRLMNVRGNLATSTIQFTTGGDTFYIDSSNRRIFAMIVQFYDDQITDIETQLVALGVELDG